MPLSFGDFHYDRNAQWRLGHTGPLDGYSSKGRAATMTERREMLIHKAYTFREREEHLPEHLMFEINDALAFQMSAQCPSWTEALWPDDAARQKHAERLAKFWHAHRYYYLYHIDQRFYDLPDAEVERLCPSTGSSTRGDPPAVYYSYQPPTNQYDYLNLRAIRGATGQSPSWRVLSRRADRREGGRNDFPVGLEY